MKASNKEEHSIAHFLWAKGQHKMSFKLRCTHCMVTGIETSNTHLVSAHR